MWRTTRSNRVMPGALPWTGDTHRPGEEGDLQRKPPVRGGAERPGAVPPVAGHLDVGREDGDEEPGGGERSGAARPGYRDGGGARDLGRAAEVGPGAGAPRQRGRDQRVVRAGEQEVHRARAREQRREPACRRIRHVTPFLVNEVPRGYGRLRAPRARGGPLVRQLWR